MPKYLVTATQTCVYDIEVEASDIDMAMEIVRSEAPRDWDHVCFTPLHVEEVKSLG